MRSLEEGALLSRLRHRSAETAAFCAGLGLCALCVPSVLSGVLVALVSISVAAWARVPRGPYLRLLAGAAGFCAVSLLPLSVSVTVSNGLHIAFDPRGMRAGILAATRAAGTLSATLLLSGSVPFPRLVALLRRMGAPALCTDLLALVHREIFLLDETSARLRMALASRGSGATLRTLSMGASALFVQSLERARRLEDGLASRGSSDGDVRWLEEPVGISVPAMLAAIAVPAAVASAALWGRSRLGI